VPVPAGPNPLVPTGPNPLVPTGFGTGSDTEPPSAPLTGSGLPQRRPLNGQQPEAVEPEPEPQEPTGLWAEHEHDTDDLPVPAPTPVNDPAPRTIGLPQRVPASALSELTETRQVPRRPEPEPMPAPAPAPVAQADPMPTASTRLQPVPGEAPTPIYQRMVSEWLVEPASATAESGGNGASWSSPGDAGWSAAASAGNPPTSSRTSGGLPIRKPGAQLVPGGLTPAEEAGARDPEEIRNNLTRHLSGVRSGRAEIQYNDGGLE